MANPAAKSYMSPEQAVSQRDIADDGSKVNFWQWSPRREKYQEIWNESSPRSHSRERAILSGAKGA